MSFSSKTALVTGAAVGIGRATAIKLASGGANLVIVDRDTENLERVKAETEIYGGQVLAASCDISNEKEVFRTVSQAEAIFGHVDILVNNAAVWRSSHPFLEISTDEWKRFLEINLMGTVTCIRAVLPKMLENRFGRIINVASVAGVYGNADMVHYSATKGAVISLTKALAKEVTGSGVCVNSVSPGSVSPAENRDMDYFQESELSFAGRTGTANENANLICFLASDEASYISGQNIQIDGCRRKQ